MRHPTARALLLALLTLSWSGPAGAGEYKLYYLGGQSNMDGYGLCDELPGELDAAVEGVMIFHGNSAPDAGPVDGRGVWAQLRPGHGAGYSSDGETATYSERFGVELTFARRLRELDPEADVAVIKYSRGGTSIDRAAAAHFGSWDPDYPGGKASGVNQYDHFLATLRLATSVDDIDGDGEQDTLVPAGIVWMQGESDAAYSEAIARRYRANLERLMDLVRAALRRDDLPVVIGRISDSGRDPEENDARVWNHGAVVRAAQASYVEADGRAALVTATDGYGYSDPWHYDSAAYLDLGRKFAEAIFELGVSPPAVAPDPDPARFWPQIDAFLRWDRKNRPPERPVLFVGSSSIRFWPTAVFFPGLPVVNRGFGGAHISDVDFYYDRVLKPYRPAVVVFYAGDNDIAAGKSPQQVFRDFEALLERLGRDLNGARVLYLPIKPSLSRWSHWSAMAEVNTMVESYAQTTTDLEVVDVATAMMGEDGTPRPELFVDDGLHLNEAGYKLWSSILRSRLASAYEEVVASWPGHDVKEAGDAQ